MVWDVVDRQTKSPSASDPVELSSCELCGIGRLCLSSSLLGGDLQELKPAVRRHFELAKGQRLYFAGQSQRSVFVVRSGSLKCSDIDTEGSEQVTEFCLPGDVMALEDSEYGRHQSHAVALEHAWMCEIPLSELQRRVFGSVPLSRQVFSALCQKVHDQRHMLARLANADATCRVAAFLLSLSRRYRRRRLPHLRFRLSMDRTDIANYLGMKLETVSRSFSALQKRGLLRVHGKWVELADGAQLEREFALYLPAA